MKERASRRRIALFSPALIALVLSAALGAAPRALAQLATATLRGMVTDAGAPAGSAEVSARNVSTGATTRATATADGRYVLPGLRPGTYALSFRVADGRQAQREATISVGQSATLDVDVPAAAAPPPPPPPPPPPSPAETPAAPGEPPAPAPPGEATEQAPEQPAAVPAEVTAPTEKEPDTIYVTGQQLVETRTSEIGFNITTRKIESLPQSGRNFLNFADLAPGVRSSNSEYRKTFSSGGVSQDPNGEPLGSPQVNVFIDGVSLKSNIQQGGLVGQDSSPGNPFPQAAVLEFRVLSSNFKAEYEDAGTSVITAVTKSGGNEFHGEAFGFYQGAALRTKDYLLKKNNLAEPKYKRWQYGASLGGPILKDKLFFFGAYEGYDEDRSKTVLIGQANEANLERFGQYQGAFLSPFREDLGFAKLSWEVDAHNWVDLAGSIRDEYEIGGFGGQTAREAASRNRNRVYTGNLRWQYDGGDILNDASVDYLYYGFKPDPLNPNLVGENFEGVVRFGGGGTSQRAIQKGLTIRDAVTFPNVEFLTGTHVFKLGAKASFQNYRVSNGLFANPEFSFKEDPALGLDFSFPHEAKFGAGDPSMSAQNTLLGVFVQDDWELDDHFTLNVGVRWDYETNAKNNDYETSPEAAAALRELETLRSTMPGNDFRADDYISTGDNRDPYLTAIQPRIGLSYDLFGDQHTVFFGGFGRYFDRTLFRNAAEEELLDQYEVRTYSFSRDGSVRNGQPTIEWDPALMSRAGLMGLIDSGVAPAGELRVIRNDTRPPHTDQFSVGVRQAIYFLNAALSYSHIEARNQVGYFPLNRSTTINPMGFRDTIPVTGYGNVVAMTQARASRYDAVLFSLEKPYSKASPWTVSLAYTLAFSRERGYAFNFDHPDVAAQPYRPNAGDERHRVVLSGLVDLPLDFQLSTLAIWSTGQPYLVTDASRGFGENAVIENSGDTKNFMQLDLRVTKGFKIGPTELQLVAEVFNLFDNANFAGYDGFKPPDGNPSFGTPNSLAGPPRSFQFGMRYRF